MKQWTTPDAISVKLLKQWEAGAILSAMATGEALFPLRMPVRGPTTKNLSEQFDEVRNWIRTLAAGSKSKRGYGYVIDWAQRRLQQLGRNSIPVAVIVETAGDACRLIGKQSDAERFRQLLDLTTARVPELITWLGRNSLWALEYADSWESLLCVVEWFREHPRPGLYLRQLDIVGVDTKFIEEHRPVCAALLDQVLPPDAIAREHAPAANFEGRYGLCAKPPLIRFRILDRRHRISGLSDLSVTANEFRNLEPSVGRVFVVENETNCLAFPDLPDSLVVFGRGYAVELLVGCEWLSRRCVHYWGDIDTHGFAMLDRLREAVPNAQSFLMDYETLAAHRRLWVSEATQHDKTLSRLNKSERALYDALREQRYGDRLRLEQERIGFGCVRTALSSLQDAAELQ